LGAVSLGVDTLHGDELDAPVARRLGFKPLYVPVQECRTPEELADLIMASSCVPPLTPRAQRSGLHVLDGGLVANVPIDPSRRKGGRTLVLLSRRLNRLPLVPGHTFVQPSATIAAGTWDYTNDANLQATFDLGRRDGLSYVESQTIRDEL
jgi:predicted acylesterase/phospholipase RssA